MSNLLFAELMKISSVLPQYLDTYCKKRKVNMGTTVSKPVIEICAFWAFTLRKSQKRAHPTDTAAQA